MFHTTWDTIGSDVIEIAGKDLTPDIIREAVSDADRYKMYGDDAEAAQLFDDLTSEQQDLVLETMFDTGY